MNHSAQYIEHDRSGGFAARTASPLQGNPAVPWRSGQRALLEELAGGPGAPVGHVVVDHAVRVQVLPEAPEDEGAHEDEHHDQHRRVVPRTEVLFSLRHSWIRKGLTELQSNA